MRSSSNVSHSSGSIVVEFAIIVPFVFALIFAIVDISRIFLSNSFANDILVKLSNFYRYEALSTISYSQVQSKAQALSGTTENGLSNVNNISVSMVTYKNISDLLNDAEQQNAGLLGGSGDIVKYTLHYSISPLTPFANYFYPSDAFVKSVTLISINGN
ncbi:MAG: TadE family protein [Sneathiella sp.]